MRAATLGREKLPPERQVLPDNYGYLAIAESMAVDHLRQSAAPARFVPGLSGNCWTRTRHGAIRPRCAVGTADVLADLANANFRPDRLAPADLTHATRHVAQGGLAFGGHPAP
jgi:hypothetical protein